MEYTEIPVAVARYLGSISVDNRMMAYICLNNDKTVKSSGGALAQCGVSSLDETTPIQEQIDTLIGMLPVRNEPVVILNAQIIQSLFIDLHIFQEDGVQWIVVFDNTRAARALQVEQQERLSSDIVDEGESG